MLRRVGLSIATAALLSGCGASFLDGFSGSEPVRRLTVTDAAIRIGGPDGYCVDPGLSRSAADSALVILAGCNSISGSQVPAPDFAAIALVSVLSRADGQPQIAQTLSDVDEAGFDIPGIERTTQVRRAAIEDNILFVEAERQTTPLFAEALPVFWRSYFDQGPMILSVTLLGSSADPLAPIEGRELLKEFTYRIQDLNAAAPEPVEKPRKKRSNPFDRFRTLFR